MKTTAAALPQRKCARVFGLKVGALCAALCFFSSVSSARAQDDEATPAPKPSESSGSHTELPVPESGELEFGFHGYFRAPALLTVRKRAAADQRPGDTGDFDYRPPRLIDNDFYRSRFAYLPINETAWAEAFLSAGNERVSGTIALAAGDYSDSSYSGLVSPSAQKGIFQGFLTLRYAPKLGSLTLRTQLKAGAFWERLGYLPKYDTYIFGRVHNTGARINLETDVDRLDLGLMLGAGYHFSESVAKEGLTNVLYSRLQADWDELFGGGLYYLYAFAQDKAAMGTPPDGKQEVAGFELWADLPFLGQLRGAFSTIAIEQPESLAGVIEVMHTEKPVRFETYAGQGFTKTKTMNLALQADLSARRIAGALGGALPGKASDVVVSAFNEYVKVNESDAAAPTTPDPFTTLWVGRPGRRFHKWGAELAVRPLSWFGASLRYDKVNLDLDEPGKDFVALSPRVTFYPALGFGSEALIYFQYTRYGYGGGMTSSLQPNSDKNLGRWFDTDVFKVQAQMSF